MKKLRRFWLISLIALLCVSTTVAFHAPPWDTGHNSFTGDPGDDDADPGDDGPCKSGSPVELASGNFVHSARDLLIVGLGPAIDLTRTYNSRDMHKGPFGNGWVFPYDQRLIETTNGTQVFAICSQPNGKRDIFTRKADGSYQPPPHVRATLVKNSDNTHTLRENTGIARRFNADGRLVSLTDRNGNTLTLAYDTTGFPTSITDASGRVVQFTKGADGRIASLTDPANRLFRYTYDSVGNLTRFTDPLGNATNYQYDSKSNLTAILDPRGNRLMGVTYDTKGRVTTLFEGAETWTYSYLTNPLRTTKRDSSNNTWTYFYNTTGNLTKLTDPLGNSETYTYDANLNLTEFVDKNGNKTTYTYDTNGNPLTITDALGGKRSFTYDPNFNHPLTARDRGGNLTRYEYDAKGNLIKTTNPLGQSTQFQYSLKGQLATIIDAAGKTTSLEYDADGNLIRIKNALGFSSSSTFDMLGQVLTVTDAEGRQISYVYDANQRVTRTTDARGGNTVNEFDIAGNITAVTLPNGARTVYVYDALNRLVKATNPLNQVTSFTYDRRNNLLSKIDPKGQLIQYSYDATDRLTQKSRPDGPVSYTYDRVGNLLTVTDPDSSLVFVVDALNRMTETRTGATAHQPASIIRYTYDANGNRRTMTDPAGSVTNYTYDPLSRLATLTDPSLQTYAFTYDALSRRQQISRSGGPTTNYNYDSANRLESLLSQSAAGNLALNYAYGPVGNRLSLVNAAGVHTYTYDNLNRLTGVIHPGASGPNEAYTYDTMGNRTASHLSASYVYNAANRLMSDAQFDYQYDANGNLANKTERAAAKVTSYTYDSENQLTRIDFPSNTSALYSYDGLGRRIEKNVNGQIQRFVYDGQDILFEFSTDGTVGARYTHGPDVDEVLSVRRGNTTSFFESDAQGSIIRVSDGVNVKATYEYDSFGRVVKQTGTSQAPYLFQGREFDSESGAYYLRARYYDPALGRFLNEDPIGFAGGLNYYQFALSNPVNGSDPFGLRPCTDQWIDDLQTLLDLAGLIPGFGEFFDLFNAGIYGLRGDALNAGLSLGSAIPILGWGSTAAKLGIKGASRGQDAFAAGKWLTHFEKHGAEFGYKNSVEYLRGGQKLLQGGPGVETFVRKNGDTLFYREATNEFGVRTQDGIIRTYFKPVEGKQYWSNQTGLK
jgi:RHS repeat-associated protein